MTSTEIGPNRMQLHNNGKVLTLMKEKIIIEILNWF